MTEANTKPAEAHYAIAGQLLDALVAHDFDALESSFDDDATLKALLPSRVLEKAGAAEIRSAFTTWFGDVEEFELTDATVGAVGPLLQLRWLLRVRGGPRFADGAHVVEQCAYATTGPTGRITHLSLLCSGFWPDQ